MEFFVLMGSLGNEIGEYPQGFCFEDEEEDNIHVEMFSKGRFTDLLNIDNIYQEKELVISQRVFKTINLLFPSNVKIRNVVFRGKQSKEPYYSVKFIDGLDDIIDFENSTYFLRGYLGSSKKIEVVDYLDFVNKCQLTSNGLFNDESQNEMFDYLECNEIAFRTLPSDCISKIVTGSISFYKEIGLCVNCKFYEMVKDFSGFRFEKLNYNIVEKL